MGCLRSLSSVFKGMALRAWTCATATGEYFTQAVLIDLYKYPSRNYFSSPRELTLVLKTSVSLSESRNESDIVQYEPELHCN